jgi:ADP-heptose:LPS heptosyltransferase
MIKKLKATLLKMVTNVNRKPFRKQCIKSIIILRYDRIGDMVVSLPLCKSLKLGFPDAKVTIIASEANACIAQECKFIDQTVIKPLRLSGWLRVLTSIRADEYDIAIDLNHSVTPHTIFAIRILNPKHVATPFKDGRWGVRGTDLKLFDLMPAQHGNKYARPISETYLDIARMLGCPTQDCLPYPLSKSPRPAQMSKNYIVLNPTGSRRTMRFPDQDLITIVDHICSLTQSIHIVIPAMQANYKQLTNQFEGSSQVDILPPSPSIEPALPVIQFAKLIITPDTALVHVACAYTVPLVAVYSGNEALFNQWRPYFNPTVSVIRAQELNGIGGYSLPDLLSSLTEKLNSIAP